MATYAKNVLNMPITGINGNLLALTGFRRSSTFTPEPETLDHRDRVALAGGVGLDLRYVDDCIKLLKSRSIYGLCLCWHDPRFGVKINGQGRVTTAFSIDPAYRDAVSVDGYDGPSINLGFSNQYEFQFAGNLLQVPTLPLGATGEYAFVVLGRMAIADNKLLGYEPDGNSSIIVATQYGKPRFAHALAYSGADVQVPIDSPNYLGQTIRFFARWKANREPNELIAGGAGQFGVYSSSVPRGPMGTTRQNKIYYLGGASVYGSLATCPDGAISTACVMATENVNSVFDLDFFVRDQFNMLS